MPRPSRIPVRPAVAAAGNATLPLLQAASAHLSAGRPHAAEELCRHVLAIDAASADALHLLALARCALGDPAAAVPLLERTIRAQRHNAACHNSMGSALLSLGDCPGAIASFRRALRIRPDHARTHSNLGVALDAAGRTREALASFERAAALDPADADVRFHLGMALLKTGDFARGWTEYEFRPSRRILLARGVFAQVPEWSGEPLEGRTLLLLGEQGYGDTIQFARYAAQLASAGVRIILAARRELLPLLAALPGLAAAVPDDEQPPADFACALGSLPLRMHTRLENLPAAASYLAAPPGRAAMLRPPRAGALRVGLVWAGNPEHSNDRYRSMPLPAFAPLAAIPGVELYSLQKGAPAAAAASCGFPIEDLGEALHDFGDTAAALLQLDCLVTVDTAAAHLAGALGRRVMTLLPAGSDWRWLETRDDSPWYPTMRLFRRTASGSWSTVVAEVAKAIASGMSTDTTGKSR